VRGSRFGIAIEMIRREPSEQRDARPDYSHDAPRSARNTIGASIHPQDLVDIAAGDQRRIMAHQNSTEGVIGEHHTRWRCRRSCV